MHIKHIKPGFTHADKAFVTLNGGG